MIKRLHLSPVKLGFIMLILFVSCTGERILFESLVFYKTETPKTVVAGQLIVSKVTLLYSTSSFHVHFRYFLTKEIAPHHFLIEAAAMIRTNGQSSVTATTWLMDTTYTLQTTSPGLYVLDFPGLQTEAKSDTIFVQ